MVLSINAKIEDAHGDLLQSERQQNVATRTLPLYPEPTKSIPPTTVDPDWAKRAAACRNFINRLELFLPLEIRKEVCRQLWKGHGECLLRHG
jgi:hypothetical protein